MSTGEGVSSLWEKEDWWAVWVGFGILIFAVLMAGFEYGDDHPFKPLRAKNTLELCRRYGMLYETEILRPEPTPAEPDLLLLAHHPGYLENLERVSRGEYDIAMLAQGKFPDCQEYTPTINTRIPHAALAIFHDRSESAPAKARSSIAASPTVTGANPLKMMPASVPTIGTGSVSAVSAPLNTHTAINPP